MSQEAVRWLDERIEKLEKELQLLHHLRQLITQAEEAPKHEDFDSLPWRPFKDGNGEWIFENEAGENLLSLLMKGGGKAQVEGYTYMLAEGKGKRFVRRKPLK